MPDNSTDLSLDERELGAVLAGLRLYQMWLEGTIVVRNQDASKHLEAVACGAGNPLELHEVDTLCERINV